MFTEQEIPLQHTTCAIEKLFLWGIEPTVTLPAPAQPTPLSSPDLRTTCCKVFDLFGAGKTMDKIKRDTENSVFSCRRAVSFKLALELIFQCISPFGLILARLLDITKARSDLGQLLFQCAE